MSNAARKLEVAHRNPVIEAIQKGETRFDRAPITVNYLRTEDGKKVSHGAKNFLRILINNWGRFNPTIRTCAQIMECSDDTISNWLKELDSAQTIDRWKLKRQNIIDIRPEADWIFKFPEILRKKNPEKFPDKAKTAKTNERKENDEPRQKNTRKNFGTYNDQPNNYQNTNTGAPSEPEPPKSNVTPIERKRKSRQSRPNNGSSKYSKNRLYQLVEQFCAAAHPYASRDLKRGVADDMAREVGIDRAVAFFLAWVRIPQCAEYLDRIPAKNGPKAMTLQWLLGRYQEFESDGLIQAALDYLEKPTPLERSPATTIDIPRPPEIEGPKNKDPGPPDMGRKVDISNRNEPSIPPDPPAMQSQFDAEDYGHPLDAYVTDLGGEYAGF